MKPIEIDRAIARIPVGGSLNILGYRIEKVHNQWGAGYTYHVDGIDRPWTRRLLLNFLTREHQEK